MPPTSIPIAADLFTWPSDEPRLLGTRCTVCGTVMFPMAPSCAALREQRGGAARARRRGSLWTFTTQGFLPKWPYTGPETEASFTGFGLGYVELPGEVMVETRLTLSDPADLTIGMELELVIVPFRTEPDGTQVMTYAFGPVSGGSP